MVFESLTKTIGSTTAIFSRSATKVPDSLSTSLSEVMPPLWAVAGRSHNLIRIAGLSGSIAVVLGAVGSHKLKDVESKTILETANRFHFFHSLAMLCAPMTKYPFLTGGLLLTGTCLFSGVLYYRAFTGNKTYSHLAPFGGSCLILAWLSFML